MVELDPEALFAQPELWQNGPAPLKAVKESLEKTYGQTIPLDVFRRTVESAINKGLLVSETGKALPMNDALLKTRVRLPKTTLATEAVLTPKQLQDLMPVIAKLKQSAPDLEFSFRVIITAEGETPANELREKLNGLLGEVKNGWKM